ncbi:MAG: hypothetical protein PHE89_06195 [Alphaproteobacteria bacterium]|nr:hypothetical protein [Alphaproteobacteria bacterium]
MKIIEDILSKLRNYKYKLSALLSCFLLSACGMTHRNQALFINNAMINGNYQQIAGETLSTTDFSKVGVKDLSLLNSLNGGTSAFLLEDYNCAVDIFEHADQGISQVLQENIMQSGGKAAAETLANASLFDYQPSVMDSLYLSSYKILSALAVEDKEGARIEVNKAYEKQKYASEYFSKEIDKSTEEVKEEAKNLDKQNQENLSGTTKDIINKNFADLKIWQGYKDYMNPYTTYLSGLYFMTNGQSRGDFESASTYMKRVAGMMPQNTSLKKDLKQAEALANTGTASKDKYVWIIYENGMIADFDEIRIDVPTFIVSNQISFVSFALPKPRLRNQAFPEISASFSKGTKVKTELLADVDNMLIAEYNKKLPTLVAKATAKTISTAMMQYQMGKELGPWAQLAATAYSLAITSADLRSWYVLPKNVQVAKLKLGKEKTLELFVNESMKLGDIDVPVDQNSIVYIRIPSIMAKPIISVIKL